MGDIKVKRAVVRDRNGVPRMVSFGGEEGGSGKRTFRGVTVGSSAAGWTEKDCDFLCDGHVDYNTWSAILSEVHEGGGQILFLDGEYEFESAINISGGTAPVTLSGCGEGTILKMPANMSSIRLMSTRNKTIQNMTIIEKGETYNSSAIACWGSQNITIWNVTIKGYSGYAIDLRRWTETQNVKNIIVEDCKVDTKYSAIIMIGVDNCRICRNIITISEGLEQKAGTIRYSAYSGATYCPGHSIIISDNIILSEKQQTSDGAVGVEPAENCIVQNNSMRNFAYLIPRGTIIKNCLICGNLLTGAIAEAHPDNALQESVIVKNNLTVLRTEEAG